MRSFDCCKLKREHNETPLESKYSKSVFVTSAEAERELRFYPVEILHFKARKNQDEGDCVIYFPKLCGELITKVVLEPVFPLILCHATLQHTTLPSCVSNNVAAYPCHSRLKRNILLTW